jgi:hypothetical protein
MRTLELAEATAPLAHYARTLKKSPVVVTVEGKPVAALVDISNADMETVTLSMHPKFIALIERSRARLKAEGGIPSAEMRRRLGLKKGRRRS